MRVLIIRFSSFGDIFQALVVPAELRRHWKVEHLGWLTRADFAELLHGQDPIDEVIAFDRRSSLSDLIRLAWKLGEQFDTVYDAHSNLRSLIVRSVIKVRWLFGAQFQNKVFVRSKERIRRFLFFKLRLEALPSPYKGAESYLWPLFGTEARKLDQVAWHPSKLNATFVNWQEAAAGPIVALAPSAAWPNKRWPTERWSELTKRLIASRSDLRFALLGGPDDGFLNTIADALGEKRVFNGVGRLTLTESASLLSGCQLLIANDTGLLHVADRLQMPLIAIIGPTAFGYPSGPLAKVAEVPRSELSCKPCSKDGRDACRNPEKLKCLNEVSVAQVAKLALESLA